MQTFQYTRPQRRSGTLDSYDSLATRYPSQSPTVEYWTNGTTTHLMTTPESPILFSSESLPSSVDPKTTKPTTRRPSAFKRELPKDNVVRNSLVAGSVAGIASTVACYPFDVLRTKMQSAAATSNAGGATRGGPVQVFLHTIQHGGVRALYTGLALPLTAQAVYKATVFTVNNVAQQALIEWKTQERYKLGNFSQHSLTLSDRFLCGAVGGAINGALFVTPVEYVRNQLIAQHTRLATTSPASTATAASPLWRGPRDVIRHTLLSNKGAMELWRGMGATIARDSFGCGCFFVMFHWSFSKLQQEPSEAASTSARLMAGGAAGLAYWVAALPIDTAKTWVQNGTVDSARSAVSQAISEEGWLSTAKRLGRGWQVAYGRGIPAAAITMTAYEMSYKYVEQM